MLGWLLAIGALLYAAARVFAGYPDAAGRTRCLAAREVAFLDAAAEATFPPDGAIELSGGEVKNAILLAAYRAAHEGQRITNNHLFEAACSEAAAAGRMVRHFE